MQEANSERPVDEADPVPVDGDPAGDDAVAVDPAPDIAELLRKAETEAAELKDAWLRARADTDNVRKQAANDVAKAHKYAIERFAEGLLPVRDALEQTLEQARAAAAPDVLVSGVELTLRQLASAFEKAGISVVDPQPGERFDPYRHEAMTMVPSDQPANSIVGVLQKGYLINDRVLRAARVMVSKGTGSGA